MTERVDKWQVNVMRNDGKGEMRGSKFFQLM